MIILSFYESFEHLITVNLNISRPRVRRAFFFLSLKRKASYLIFYNHHFDVHFSRKCRLHKNKTHTHTIYLTLSFSLSLFLSLSLSLSFSHSFFLSLSYIHTHLCTHKYNILKCIFHFNCIIVNVLLC